MLYLFCVLNVAWQLKITPGRLLIFDLPPNLTSSNSIDYDLTVDKSEHQYPIMVQELVKEFNFPFSLSIKTAWNFLFILPN